MCTFCVHCGRCAGIGPELATDGLCPRCHHQNDPDDITCGSCGLPLPPLPGQTRKGTKEDEKGVA